MRCLGRCCGLLAISIAGVAWALLASGPASADEPSGDPMHLHDANDVWSIARGARLYDNWMEELLAHKPRTNHPAYPASGKMRGYPTWRCKECHGWDYKGNKGAYKLGDHATGIRGVFGVRGKDPDEIYRMIIAPRHGFSEAQMPHAALELLSIFLSRGQIDSDKYIDRNTRKARGDFKRGGRFYKTVCATCHGVDGKDINFKSKRFPEFVGTVCAKNPWEALHKIRFGQPGVGMIALANQEIQFTVDILAYCQTLPPK